MRNVVLWAVSSGLPLYPHWGPAFGERVANKHKLAAAAFARVPGGSTIPGDRNFGVSSMAWKGQQRRLGVLVRLTKDRAHNLFGGPITAAIDAKLTWQPSRHDQVQAGLWPGGAAVTVRLIAARVGRGKSKQWLYPFTALELLLDEIKALFGQCWNVETDLRLLKRTIHLQ